MSTGTLTMNGLAPVSTDAGPGFEGSFLRKVWNGADSPRKPKSPARPRGRKGPADAKDDWRLLDFSRLPPPKRAFKQENPYNMSYDKFYDGVMEVKLSPMSAWTTCTFRNFFGNYVVDYGDQGPAMLAAVGKLRNRVVGSSFNAAVAMAEGREALQMITNAATGVFQMYQALRKKDLVGAVQALVQANKRRSRTIPGRKPGVGDVTNDSALTTSSVVLQLQYGWMPLLSDAKAGAEFLAHLTSVPLQDVKRVKVRYRAVSVESGSPTLCRFSETEAWTDLRIKAILREADIVKLSGLTDPLSLAWELLPFSFVADWFIPISSYLQARSLAQALKGTFVVSSFSKCKLGKPVSTGFAGFDLRGSSYRAESVRFTRVIRTDLDIPLPEVKPLSAWSTWARAVSATALLVQNFGSHSSTRAPIRRSNLT